ncbi:hypothetical protein LXL04_024315 [Taraxacum kok-saghyz]
MAIVVLQTSEARKLGENFKCNDEQCIKGKQMTEGNSATNPSQVPPPAGVDAFRPTNPGHSPGVGHSFYSNPRENDVVLIPDDLTVVFRRFWISSLASVHWNRPNRRSKLRSPPLSLLDADSTSDTHSYLPSPSFCFLWASCQNLWTTLSQKFNRLQLAIKKSKTDPRFTVFLHYIASDGNFSNARSSLTWMKTVE